MPPELVEIRDLSQAEFLERHAAPGRVGLAGGNELASRLIQRAQRLTRPDRRPSEWSHAFLFTGTRLDGRHWVLESDLNLDLRHKTMRLGVQENRIDKYFSAESYPRIAVLDFGLDDAQALSVIREGLNLLAGHTVYSMREVVGTLLAMARPARRTRDNLLTREGALYCSAMVQHCFSAAGVRFQRRVHEKNTTPDDILRSPAVRAGYIRREMKAG